jgi:hypothetical protein
LMPYQLQIRDERREQVKELMIRGLSYEEITKNVSVRGRSFDRSTIRRDIAWIKWQQVTWWTKNKKIRMRFGHYFKQQLDASVNATKRAWEQYQKADLGNDPRSAIRALQVIGTLQKQQSELLGFARGNLNDIEVKEMLELLDKIVHGLPELKKIADKFRKA